MFLLLLKCSLLKTKQKTLRNRKEGHDGHVGHDDHDGNDDHDGHVGLGSHGDRHDRATTSRLLPQTAP